MLKKSAANSVCTESVPTPPPVRDCWCGCFSMPCGSVAIRAAAGDAIRELGELLGVCTLEETLRESMRFLNGGVESSPVVGALLVLNGEEIRNKVVLTIEFSMIDDYVKYE